MAEIPLSEVLQRTYLAAEGDLRRLGIGLDNHRRAAGRSQWHWYPQSAADPRPSTDRIHNLLLDAAIKLYDTGVDWLELTLYIAWGTSLPDLIVNAAVEVACWCPQDHNMHAVREVQSHVTNSKELIDAFNAGTTMLSDVMDTGPYEPSSWRIRARLPDAPSSP